jgi:hypothetical protein
MRVLFIRQDQKNQKSTFPSKEASDIETQRSKTASGTEMQLSLKLPLRNCFLAISTLRPDPRLHDESSSRSSTSQDNLTDLSTPTLISRNKVCWLDRFTMVSLRHLISHSSAW